MSTYLAIINRALAALGQGDDLVSTSATTLTDNYHIKVAEWVNDFLEQTEDAAQWRVLRTRDTATVTARALSATLASSNKRSKPFYVVNQEAGGRTPLCFDVTDTVNNYPLTEIDLAELLFMDQSDKPSQTGSTATHPEYFAVNQTATGVDIYIYPRCVGAISIQIDMVIPQGRLLYTSASSTTGLLTEVKVPEVPVVFGTVWWAQEDRGEELGANGAKSEKRFTDKLSELASQENAAQGFDELMTV
jgi:hypothetical protein